jgi:hypothetical protein
MSESYQEPGRVASAVDRSSCVSQCRSVRRARCSRVQQPHLVDFKRLPTLGSHARDGAVLERANHLRDARKEPPTKIKIIAAAGTLRFCRRRWCSRQHKAERSITLTSCRGASPYSHVPRQLSGLSVAVNSISPDAGQPP